MGEPHPNSNPLPRRRIWPAGVATLAGALLLAGFFIWQARLVLAERALSRLIAEQGLGPVSLDAPRAAGSVGERWDGFSEVRDANASSEVKALVATTNGHRQQVYQKRASAEGIPMVEVGKVYAQQILTGAPSGTWSLSENGSWSQK